ncbi:MAG TPA: class I SAM-dependent methyltransferase [Blastocatellia bacterium]|nr:class I SAM-dependent methyltransferase [Blastocatellia bacterium]
MARNSILSIDEHSTPLSPPIGGGVIVDLGTGDGNFVYQSARRHPDRFYIGIDAQSSALEKISEKIHRKPAKGGAPNVLFIQATVEDLPPELDGVADEIHAHFPWGSLLRALATGDEAVLRNLRRICAPDAWLEVVMALDPERDRAEIERLGLSPLSLEFLETTLIPRYRAASFDVVEYGSLPPSEWPQIHTSWAQRLRGATARPLSYLIARAVGT